MAKENRFKNGTASIDAPPRGRLEEGEEKVVLKRNATFCASHARNYERGLQQSCGYRKEPQLPTKGSTGGGRAKSGSTIEPDFNAPPTLSDVL